MSTFLTLPLDLYDRKILRKHYTDEPFEMPSKIKYLVRKRTDFQKEYEMALLTHEENSRQVAWKVFQEKEL